MDFDPISTEHKRERFKKAMRQADEFQQGIMANKSTRELPRCPTCGKPEDVTIDEKGEIHIIRANS